MFIYSYLVDSTQVLATYAYSLYNDCPSSAEENKEITYPFELFSTDLTHLSQKKFWEMEHYEKQKYWSADIKDIAKLIKLNPAYFERYINNDFNRENLLKLAIRLKTARPENKLIQLIQYQVNHRLFKIPDLNLEILKHLSSDENQNDLAALRSAAQVCKSWNESVNTLDLCRNC